jgi:branched-chain amino acid aminotransferase
VSNLLGAATAAALKDLIEAGQSDGVATRIQAANAGADEALMLDPHGFVATCNSTHFFIVRRGELWTSTGQYCIPGITRGNMIRLAKDLGIPVFEKPFSLYDVYGADEAFVTGTFAGLIP